MLRLTSLRFGLVPLVSRVSLAALAVFFSAAGCGDDAPAPLGNTGGGNVGNSSGVGNRASGGDAGPGGAGGTDAGASHGGAAEAGAPDVAGTDAGGAPSICNDGKGAVITGRVFAPNGELPLGGVTVYVPSSTVDLPPEGAGCFRCSGAFSGVPVARAVTDADGKFELTNTPVGEEVPLVVQTGKWRRTLSLSVVDCQENSADEAGTRLPAKRSEGHLPSIALASGGEDTLECLLRKLGIDDTEFAITPDAGRVQLFQAKGGIAGLAGVANSELLPADVVWADAERLGVFDLVLLGSEPDANAAAKPPAALDALHDYVAAGGRVLLQHFQSYFVSAGAPALSSLATFTASTNLPNPTTLTVDTSSPRGSALSASLTAADPAASPGTLSVTAGKNGVSTVASPAVRLLYATTPQTVQAFSVDLPTSGDKAGCGRLTQTDLLTGSGDTIADFPSGCTSNELNAQERALAYLIFDLGACVP